MRGHRYTMRVILRPISVAHPRIDLCTKNPSPGHDWHHDHILRATTSGLAPYNEEVTSVF